MNGVYVNMGGSYNVSHTYFVRSAIRNRWVTAVHESDTLGFRTVNGVYRGGGFNMMTLNLRDGVRAGVYKWSNVSNNRGFRFGV